MAGESLAVYFQEMKRETAVVVEARANSSPCKAASASGHTRAPHLTSNSYFDCTADCDHGGIREHEGVIQSSRFL